MTAALECPKLEGYMFHLKQARIYDLQRAGVQTLEKGQTNKNEKEMNITHISVITR